MRNYVNANAESSKRASTVRVQLMIAGCVIWSSIIFCSFVRAQNIDGERFQGRAMLGVIKNDLNKNYYDPAFHGSDLETRFAKADEKIKQATSFPQILGIVAQTLLDFDDSHTFFKPPRSANRVEHGWQMQMIGDECYVVAVQPGSDAESKGLRAGDRIINVEGFKPTRTNLWKLEYVFHVISPRAGMNLIVQKPDGQKQTLMVMGKVHEGKKVISLETGVASDIYDLVREDETLSRLYRHRLQEIGDLALVWKMPEFDLIPRQVDEAMDKAQKHKALILDLRGNGGGAEEMLLRLIGSCFDHDVKVADIKGRRDSKPLIAKTRGGSHVFTGQIVVLIDSGSGSAAEIFARVMQLEKRGTVIGDKSAGAVMRSRIFPHELGNNLVFSYGAYVTVADLLMTDGKSLERVGVMPDERLTPSGADLAANRVPVLAHAAQLVNWQISLEKAGALFPVEWRK